MIRVRQILIGATAGVLAGLYLGGVLTMPLTASPSENKSKTTDTGKGQPFSHPVPPSADTVDKAVSNGIGNGK
jgi:hypothetical protein